MPLPTLDEYVTAYENSLRGDLDPSGTGSVDLSDGADLTALGSAVVAMELRSNVAVAQSIADRDSTSATGPALDDVARDRYLTKRKAANAATSTFYLTRAATTATTIPKGSRFSAPAADSTPAVYFAADDDVATSSTKVAIPCTCTQEGEIGNIAHGNVTEIVDPLPDSTWALFTPSSGTPGPAGETSPAAVGGGSDRETDPILQQRLNLLPQDAARRPGTPDGILFGVLETPGVRFATFADLGNGTVAVYAGDANYTLSEALSRAISDNLDSGTYSASGAPGYRGGGIPVLVRSFTTTRVIHTATIYMNKPVYQYDTSALLGKAIAAATTYYDNRPFADEYIKNRVERALLSCSDDTQDVSLTISPTDGNVLRKAGSGYVGNSTIVRYYVDSSSWRISFAGPQTQ